MLKKNLSKVANLLLDIRLFRMSRRAINVARRKQRPGTSTNCKKTCWRYHDLAKASS